MTGRGRQAYRFALAALLAWAPPLAAQTVANSAQPATNTTTAAPPPASDTVGPRELRNFNLGGTVTRRAEPEPAPTAAPVTARPAPRTVPAANDKGPPRQATPRPQAAPPRPSPEPGLAAPAGTAVSDLAPTDAAPTAPSPPIVAAPALPDSMTDGMAWWPLWLAALALAASGAFLLWRRQQQRPVTSGVGEMLERQAVPAPAPSAAPPRPATPPATAPAPAARRPVNPVASGGIVSRGLAPNLTFQFTPLRAEIDGNGAALLSFELVVHNAGGAPARELLVEALMVNAGPRQDEEIGYFFKNPVGRGERIALVPPMGKVTIRSRVPLPAERLSPLEIEGRKLLVPLVAINALYRSINGETQQSASFLVGRGGEDGGKMAPFTLDRGARAWTGLSTRQHSAGLQG